MARRGTLAGVTRGAAGSWSRTLVSAAALVVLFAAAFGVAAVYGPLRQTSFPGHPYPPAGYYRNPFSTDPNDLVNAADASAVKVDFSRDGNVELAAFARGDTSLLGQGDAGNRLARLRQLIEEDTATGVVLRYTNRVDSVVVGRLRDPASAAADWCVQESGQTTLDTLARSNGQVLGSQTYRFEGKFWLTKAGAHYLITDAEVANQPTTS